MIGSLVLIAAMGCDAETEPVARSGDKTEQEAPEQPAEPLACFNSKECAADKFCLVPEGECGREGVCTPVPLECTRERDLVCSCDGADYKNPCFAALDKQSVDFHGKCPPPPCSSNADCPSTAYCAKAAGACTGDGVCEPKPTSCSGVWNPVCGCNSLTYANGCKAAAVGVSVGHLGAC